MSCNYRGQIVEGSYFLIVNCGNYIALSESGLLCVGSLDGIYIYCGGT